MNIQNLLKYLKNDLGELTEILTDLSPGQSLSQMEIKLIKSRIRSLSEEFEMLESEIGNKPAQPKKKTAEQPVAKPDKTTDKAKTEVPETAKNEITHQQETEKDASPGEEESQTEEQIQEDEKEEANLTHEANEELAETEQIREEETDIEEPPSTEEQEKLVDENQGAQKRTIAEKYEGSSKSLHERIANLVEQKDLASKLQQNPIEDLTKAIKLNDKIWFINTLFGGDADLYRETVNRINQMNNLDEALQFLELNFEFDQQEDSFKSFIEFIYRRFLD